MADTVDVNVENLKDLFRRVESLREGEVPHMVKVLEELEEYAHENGLPAIEKSCNSVKDAAAEFVKMFKDLVESCQHYADITKAVAEDLGYDV